MDHHHVLECHGPKSDRAIENVDAACYSVIHPQTAHPTERALSACI